jgi:hypothetical protein
MIRGNIMNFETSSTVPALPIYLSEEDAASLLNSPIAPFLLSYAESSSTHMIEIGDSRPDMPEELVNFLDDTFSGLLDIAFDSGAEFIFFTLNAY